MLSKYDFPAVILAGGKSQRMGEDKALLPFGGEKSMALYQYHKLTKLFSQVYLSSKSAKFGFDAPIVYDLYPQSSPLVALLSIFGTLMCKKVFILSVDTPLVNESQIVHIIDAYGKNDVAVIAQTSDGIHPLCGLYTFEAMPKATQLYTQNNHKLKTLLDNIQTRKVYFDESEYFVNLNYMSEYLNYKKLLTS